MDKIAITAGHGGSDPGATSDALIKGKLERLKEAELAVSLRNKVVFYLNQNQEPVLSDGVGYTNLPLNKAIEIAKQSDLAIEFHFNAAKNTKVKGIEVLCSPQNKALAQRLAGAIHNITGSPLRGDKGWCPENAGHHSRLGYVRAGGLVVEVEFITNDRAMDYYFDVEWVVAKELAKVIMEYAVGGRHE